MCGIITVVKKNSETTATADAILGMLTQQLHRGSQGFGYVAFNEKVENFVRRETRFEIEKPLANNEARSIMFHHRLPTSTPNYADCAHPILVSHKELKYDYYVIHNGVISNHGVLKAEHEALGYVYTTLVETTTKTQSNVLKREQYNDSEALAIDLARFFEGKTDKIASVGSIAFVALQVNKKNRNVVGVWWGRNSSPLTINVTENGIVLRSEGEVEQVEADILYRLDMKTWKVDSEPVKIGEIGSSYGARYNHTYQLPEPRDAYGQETHEQQYGNEVYLENEEDLTEEEKKIDREIDKIDREIEVVEDAIEYYKEVGDAKELVYWEDKLKKLDEQYLDLLETRGEIGRY